MNTTFNNIEIHSVQYEQFDNEAVLYGKINNELNSIQLHVKQNELNSLLCKDLELMGNWTDNVIEEYELGDTVMIEMNIKKHLGRPLTVKNYAFKNQYRLIRA